MGRLGDIVHAELMATIAKWVASDQKKVQEGGKRLLTAPSEFRQKPTTVEQVALVGNCVRKGCYEDPKPVEEMYTEIGETEDGLKIYQFKGGSGKNEALHGQLNNIVSQISVTTGDSLEKRINNRLQRYNLDCDRKHGRLPEHVKTNEPWIADRANRLANGVLEAPPFPGLAPSPQPLNSNTAGYELMGYQYLLRTLNKRTANAATAAAAATPAEQEPMLGAAAPDRDEEPAPGLRVGDMQLGSDEELHAAGDVRLGAGRQRHERLAGKCNPSCPRMTLYIIVMTMKI